MFSKKILSIIEESYVEVKIGWGVAYNSEKPERCRPGPPHALFLFEVYVEWLIFKESMGKVIKGEYTSKEVFWFE